jgi:hypothetical protein
MAAEVAGPVPDSPVRLEGNGEVVVLFWPDRHHSGHETCRDPHKNLLRRRPRPRHHQPGGPRFIGLSENTLPVEMDFLVDRLAGR